MRTTHYCYFQPRSLLRLLASGKHDIDRVQQILSDLFRKPVILLNSGRTGIFLALAARGITRRDEVLVPQFLSECILNTINKAGFPSLEYCPRTKAVLVVHQFGYPQKIDKIMEYARARSLLVIEDCAFSFSSAYQGKRIGSRGDAAVFSFPKVFPTILGGCLVTEDERLLQFARDYLAQKDAMVWRLFSTITLVPTVLT
jgi:dTDP-4-amino-4,6-dideoxygalactose transaminase